MKECHHDQRSLYNTLSLHPKSSLYSSFEYEYLGRFLPIAVEIQEYYTNFDCWKNTTPLKSLAIKWENENGRKL